MLLQGMSRNWLALALRGLAAVLFGIGAFAWPGLTLVVLVALFGAYALVDGVFTLVAGAQARSWALILEGVLGMIAGLATFFWTGITAVALLALIAAWAIVTGVIEIVAAIELRRVIRNEWMLILDGLLSVAFGAILIARPGAGALAVVWVIGGYALIFGAVMIALAFRLRGLAGGAGEATEDRMAA